jgi:cell division protein FtsQ
MRRRKGDYREVDFSETIDFGNEQESFEYEEEKAEDEYVRPRKKRKKKHTFLKAFIVIAFLVAVFFVIRSDLFEIRTISVSGASHYKYDQIIKLSDIKKGDNLWKSKVRKAEKALEKDPYIKSADVKRKPLHQLDIRVQERKELFGVRAGKYYLVCDKDGIILNKVKELPAVTVLQKLRVENGKAGEALVPQQKTVLEDSISLLETMAKYDVVCTNVEIEDVNIRAYLNDQFLMKGSYKNLIGGMKYLKTVISDLQGKGVVTGTLIVSGTETCVYSPEVQ